MHYKLVVLVLQDEWFISKQQRSLCLCVLLLIYRRTVVSIPCGPSALAVKEAAWGLARYAAISQVN